MTAPAKEADRTLKANHRAMWALGDYPVLAADIISDLGQILVGACGMRPGDRVLDVAAGSGNAAIPAARAGASVVACDLTPELLAAGQRQAEREGIDHLRAAVQRNEALGAQPFCALALHHLAKAIG